MFNLNKCLITLSTTFLFGCATLIPASSTADGKLAADRETWKRAVSSLEKALPSLVSSQDYRSASNTAFLLATARSRLGETTASCAALSQSLEYYRKALAKETGQNVEAASNIDDESSGMAEVRAKFGCIRARSASSV